MFVLAMLAALPCVAQERVFRASSIDVEQDKRLDSVEQRVSMLEAVPVSQPPRPQVVPAQPRQQYAPANLVTKQPAKSTKPKAYSTIIIETLPGCEPCNRWKAKEAKELRAIGWDVIEAPLTSSNSAPFFRICPAGASDRCFTFNGFLSHDVLRRIVAASQGASQQVKQAVQQAAVSSRYTTAELRSMIQAKRPGGWHGPVYADVAPSYVKQHLVEPKHGFRREQVNGLTTDEALILHDLAPTHGNQIFPTR